MSPPRWWRGAGTSAVGLTVVGLAALLLLLQGCAPSDESAPGSSQGPSQGSSAAPAATPSVILISVDTLRADRLGCYGAERVTSPNLDALAAEGWRYTEALAPTPWTLPSHAAMLTGIHPWTLGLVNQWRSLPVEAPTLAQRLQPAGFATAAFVDSLPRGFVGAERGFDRGFDTFAHAPHDDRDPERRYDVAATVDAGLRWLDGREEPDQPFLLFLHTRSVHAVPTDEPCRDAQCYPYDQPEPFRLRFADGGGEPWMSPEGDAGQAFLWWLNAGWTEGSLDREALPAARIDELLALYDAGIYYTDHHLGRLFEGLETRGLAASTWVVVTSDHGESFLEHDLLMHQEVYRETLRVPLIVRPPTDPRFRPGDAVGQSSEPRTIETPVALEDVVPSILDWVGVDPAAAPGNSLDDTTEEIALEGRLLPRGAEEPTAERDFFAYYRFPEKFSYRAFALQRGQRKLVTHNHRGPVPGASEDDRDFVRQLFAVGAEDTELDDPARAKPLLDILRRRIATPPLAVAERGKHRDEALGADLETLGYID